MTITATHTFTHLTLHTAAHLEQSPFRGRFSLFVPFYALRCLTTTLRHFSENKLYVEKRSLDFLSNKTQTALSLVVSGSSLPKQTLNDFQNSPALLLLLTTISWYSRPKQTLNDLQSSPALLLLLTTLSLSFFSWRCSIFFLHAPAILNNRVVFTKLQDVTAVFPLWPL